MLTILLHSSKTMRQIARAAGSHQAPALVGQAIELQAQLQKLSIAQLMRVMKISQKKAEQTKDMIDKWSVDPDTQTPAIDAFIGDIYSGLQVRSFTDADRRFANDSLCILSGLYGVLRPLDGIMPYRLEMAYKLPGKKYSSLYKYWDDTIARQLPTDRPIINVSSVEYTKAVLPYVPGVRVITPKFLTRHAVTGEPTFVTVHSKVSRGAFAHWLITHRITVVDELTKFDELDYVYDALLSTPDEPVFVCDTFGGLGLSVRLT